MDGVWVDYTASTDPECRFRAAGPSFKLNNYALAYPNNFPDSVIEEWNLAMTKVQARDGIIDTLNSQYINIANNCSTSASAVSKLTINEVRLYFENTMLSAQEKPMPSVLGDLLGRSFVPCSVHFIRYTVLFSLFFWIENHHVIFVTGCWSVV